MWKGSTFYYFDVFCILESMIWNPNPNPNPWKVVFAFTDCTRSEISCKVNNLLVRDLVFK